MTTQPTAHIDRDDRPPIPSQTDVVVDGIKSMIIRGRLGPGARLPREKDLALELNVSRGPLREGVRALIDRHADLQVVGVAADYDEAVSGATAANPQVLVTDIRMPPSFSREGIDAAKEVRKRHPGTGVVILSQYEDPEYAISLLAATTRLMGR